MKGGSEAWHFWGGERGETVPFCILKRPPGGGEGLDEILRNGEDGAEQVRRKPSPLRTCQGSSSKIGMRRGHNGDGTNSEDQ